MFTKFKVRDISVHLLDFMFTLKLRNHTTRDVMQILNTPMLGQEKNNILTTAFFHDLEHNIFTLQIYFHKI